MVNLAPSFFVGSGRTPDYSNPNSFLSLAGIATAPDGSFAILGSLYAADPGWQISIVNSSGALIGSSTRYANDPDRSGALVVAAQSDGKFIAGTYYGRYDSSSGGTSPSGTTRRFNPDGTLDTGFGLAAGVSTADSISVGVDNKYIISGYLEPGLYGGDNSIRIVLIGADGDHQISKSLFVNSISNSGTRDIVLRPDGTVLLSVKFATGWSVIRLTETLDHDLSFAGGEGKVAMNISAISFIGHAMAARADGGFVMVGEIGGDFALVAHNSDGSIDTSFGGGDGIVITPVGTIGDSARAVFVDDDGNLTVTGFKYDPNIGRHDFVVTRYDENGVQDMSYGDNGVASVRGYGQGKVAMQGDGGILVTGSGMSALRIDAKGNLDRAFGSENTLGDTVEFTENGAAIVLDDDVQIFDSELSNDNGGAGNFNGASLTLERSTGAASQDVFGFRFAPASILQFDGAAIAANGVVIANVSQSGGTLRVTFTQANGMIPNTALVDEVMQAITYTNTSDMPGATVDLQWVFDDGDQGTGGAQNATGITHVGITATNDAPVIFDDLSRAGVTEGWNAQEVTVGTFTATDPEADTFNFSTSDARFGVKATATAGRFELVIRPSSNIDFEQESSIDVRVTATETGTMELLSGSRTFTLNVTNIAQEIIDASAATDDLLMIADGAQDMSLVGGNGNDRLVSDTGNDFLSGGGGNDTLRPGGGRDSLFGGTGEDRFVISFGQDTGQETYDGGTGHDTLLLAGGSGNVVHDLRTHIIREIEEIEFGSLPDGSSRTVIVTAAQIQGFGPSGWIDGIGGDASTEHLVIHMEGQSTLTLPSYVSYEGWNQTGDLTEIIAGSSNSTIIGSVFRDHIRGGSGNDVLFGGNGADLIRGDAGNDTLRGDGGNDTLLGGAGSDDLNGGAGADAASYAFAMAAVSLDLRSGGMAGDAAGDTFDSIENIKGSNFDDYVYGDNGANLIDGGAGNDRLRGHNGHDTLIGGAGADDLNGGSGIDTASYVTSLGRVNLDLRSRGTYGDAANDTFTSIENVIGSNYDDYIYGDSGGNLIQGGVGDDRLRGHDGDDTLRGGDGDDDLHGGLGDDALYGDSGDDTLTGGAGADDLRGGGGIDTASYATSSVRVNLDLRSRGTSGDALNDTFYSIENVLASDFDDYVYGDNGANLIDGGAGNDRLRGHNGHDTLIGGAGADDLNGGSGIDTASYVTSLGRVNLDLRSRGTYGDAANDTFTSIENVIGSNYDDYIYGDSGDNLLDGGADNDTLEGGGGDDTLIGGLGDDSMTGGDGNDTAILNVSQQFVSGQNVTGGVQLTSSQGVDFLGSDIEFVQFNDGTLTLTQAAALAGTIPSTINGTNAGESVDGTTATEIINGLDGADWISPGGGSDTVDGGPGNDMLSFFNLPDTPGRTNMDYRLTIDMAAGTAVSHDGAERIQFANIERLTGTIFADHITGTSSDDYIRGLGDYDWIVATEGADTIDGGTGQDMISFLEWQNTGPNTISDAFTPNGAPPTGAEATGVLVNLANPTQNTNLASGLTLVSVERVTGSARQDVFYGDDGQNDFRGLGDFDWFVSSDGGRERYYGGDGVDTVTYFNAPGAVTANLRNGAVVNGEESGYGTQGWAARDLYFEIENLVGSNFGDHLTGSADRNQLSGLDGDDFLFGYGNIDYLKGGAGNDTIDGGGSSDYALFDGDLADYTLTRTADNRVTVVGPDGNDSLIDVEYFRFDDQDVRIWDLPLV